MKKNKKKVNTYNGYKIALEILFIIYIAFVVIMMSTADNVDTIFIISIVVGLIIVFGILLFGLTVVAGDSDKNSIRILTLNFDNTDVGMKQLLNMEPTIYTYYDYIYTYVYNIHDKCYYELYVKDEIRWMRNIGTINPREMY